MTVFLMPQRITELYSFIGHLQIFFRHDKLVFL